MRKYIVAIWRMITSKKWMVITYETESKILIVSSNVELRDCRNISFEISEMAEELTDQEILLSHFKNN